MSPEHAIQGNSFYMELFEELPLPVIIIDREALKINMAAQALFCAEVSAKNNLSGKLKESFTFLYQRLLFAPYGKDIFFETLCIPEEKMVIAEIIGKLLYDPLIDYSRGLFLLKSVEKLSENYLEASGFSWKLIPTTPSQNREVFIE